MSSTVLAQAGGYRLVRYETPYPWIYEVWLEEDGDMDMVYWSYSRRNARRKFRKLTEQPPLETSAQADYNYGESV